jgi:hypothetical protein
MSGDLQQAEDSDDEQQSHSRTQAKLERTPCRLVELWRQIDEMLHVNVHQNLTEEDGLDASGKCTSKSDASGASV